MRYVGRSIVSVFLIASLVSVVIHPVIAAITKEPESFDVTAADGNTTMLLNKSATIYTHSFNLWGDGYVGISYNTSTVNNNVNVTIELEQSWTTPTTEGAADYRWSEPVNMADVVSYNTVETWQHSHINPEPLQFGRFKITENSGSATDTLVQIKLSPERR